MTNDERQDAIGGAIKSVHEVYKQETDADAKFFLRLGILALISVGFPDLWARLNGR